VIFLCAFLVTVVLSMQLVAATAWTADAANAGPGVTIVQLSQDSDSDWATQDLVNRLSEFIQDDLFIPNRISVIRTDDPHIVDSITDNIIIYVSHGGPLGIVTGRYVTSWNRMAKIIDNSDSQLHLFTACYSRNIIRYGSDDSKLLYTVPGARPAEVTNVEIVTTVMLAFGIDEATVNEYRTNELTQAKEVVESGQSVHIMDFQQIILTEIENIDGNYSDTYTSDFRVYREAITTTYTSKYDFPLLHSDLTTLIYDYFQWYVDSQGIDMPRDVSALRMNYTKNYYIESTWVSDPPPDPEPDPEPGPGPWPQPDPHPIGPESFVYAEALYMTGGHWENSTPVFTGGTYAGQVIFPGDGVVYSPRVTLNVTASGPTLDASNKTQVDSIYLNQIEPGGTYVHAQKIDGIWQEPDVGRNSARTGGAWSDSCVNVDYESYSTWPALPGHSVGEGTIHSNGDYIYVDSIPIGTGWHGPSFVRTLPSYLKMNEMGSLSANLSISHGNDGSKVRDLAVSLYDENMKVVMVLEVTDAWGWTTTSAAQKEYFSACYFLEDGSMIGLSSDEIFGDTSGIVQIRFEPAMGIYADVPGKDSTRLFKWTQINTDRLIKYVVIQSYRYGSYQLNDARVNNIQMTYAGSEYTVFHDNCNDMNEFHKDLTFPFGTLSEGNLSVPIGQSYMTWSSIPTGTSWHGPEYVHVLDRPFRLYQLSEFSVVGELVQSASTMGAAYVGLFDENQHCVLLIHWADAWVGSQQGYFNTYFYPQYGGTYYQESELISTSFTKTGKLWWDQYPGGQGGIMSSIDDSGSAWPIGECDNASRVIKYVVALGYRYGSCNLVDMRIHDITVVADPNKHAPAGSGSIAMDGGYFGSVDEDCKNAVDFQLGSTNHYSFEIDSTHSFSRTLLVHS
jgi:hypothetical protein